MTRQGRMEMRLSDWAKMEGIPLRTAQRMHSRGELPVPAFVTKTGRIMVIVPAVPLPVGNQREDLLAELRSLQAKVEQIQRRLSE